MSQTNEQVDREPTAEDSKQADQQSPPEIRDTEVTAEVGAETAAEQPALAEAVDAESSDTRETLPAPPMSESTDSGDAPAADAAQQPVEDEPAASHPIAPNPIVAIEAAPDRANDATRSRSSTPKRRKRRHREREAAASTKQQANEPESTSAQVLPADSRRIERPARVKSVDGTPPPVEQSATAGRAGRYALLVAAAGAVLGFWLLSRPSEDARQAPVDDALIAAAATEAPPSPVEPPPAALEPAVAEPAVAEPAVAEPKVADPAVVEPKVAEAAAAPPSITEPSPPPSAANDSREAIRLNALKIVSVATKDARNCRHRPDAAGTVGLVVTFGADGNVLRTTLQRSFQNPLTAQCITSKFQGLTVPPFSGAPVTVTSEVNVH